MPSTPLFSFGHGLSYTSFDFGPLHLESDTVDVSGEARLSITVTNTGSRRGTEVDAAIRRRHCHWCDAQQLVGFARVELEPGASKTVKFVMPLSLLGYTGLSGEFILEPGPVEMSAGSNSNDIRSSAALTVTGKTRFIRDEDREFLSVAIISS